MGKLIRISWCLSTLLMSMMFAQEAPARPAPPSLSVPPPQEQPVRSKRSRKHKPHSVTLKWVASTTKGVDGYFVYRAVGGMGAGYERLMATPVKATTYKDVNVESGKSYVYAVTTVMTINSRLVESAFTPQVVAKIPSP